MSDATPRLGLPWLMPARAQKHVTLNEALGRLDALVQAGVESRTTAQQPEDLEEGAAYILPASPAGQDWDGFLEADLVYFQDGAWRRVSARAGLTAWVADEAALVMFDGAAWRGFAEAITILSDLTGFGLGTAPDSGNPFAAKLNAALWTARFAGEGGTGDLRYTLNKEAQGNVLSLLFQSAWSGRAEIGLTGSDDLSIKVSPDGAAWSTALSIDRSNGAVALARADIGSGAVTGLSDLALDDGGPLAFGPGETALIRRADLGSAAFMDAEGLRLTVARSVSGAAALGPDDLGRLIIKTGAGALTLPPGTGLDPGWRAAIKNRSGAAVDLQPALPGETLNAAAPGAAVSLPDGAGRQVIYVGAGAWETV